MSYITTPPQDAVLRIIAQSGFHFGDVAQRRCPQSGILDHVLVISLERDHFGIIFEYVSRRLHRHSTHYLLGIVPGVRYNRVPAETGCSRTSRRRGQGKHALSPQG